MGKTYKDDNGNKKVPARNNVAMGMIVSGQGKKQIFRDKRDRRAKDRKNSWQHDHEQE